QRLRQDDEGSVSASSTLNAADVAVNVPDPLTNDATSVYPSPPLLIERLENVATPSTIGCVVVPESEASPGLFPIAIVIAAPSVWLSESSRLTRTGTIVAPAVVEAGSVTKARVG